MGTKDRYLGIPGLSGHVRLKPVTEAQARKRKLKRLQKENCTETNSRILTLLKVLYNIVAF